MSDNVVLNPGTGGDTVATDDVGGTHFQRIKLDVGGDGVSSPVTTGNPLPVAGPLTDAELRATPLLLAGTPADFWPGYSGTELTEPQPLLIDPSGGLATRGAVLTDEGTFRVNFANTSLGVSLGSVTISGAVVTGTGFMTNNSRDVHYHDYFKLDADGESAWLQIESIDSDTQLTLVSSYVGGSSGAASRSLMKPITGSGGSISVASGACTLASGTTNAASTYLARTVDYAPLVYRAALSISQRIANQTVFAGLSEEDTITDRWYARFKFDGTTNTTVICETARNPTTTPSGAEIQSSTVTLPNGLTTAVSNEYRVEVLTERVVFFVNGIKVAEHTRVIPAQHDTMEAVVRVTNGTGAASSTSVVVDYVTGKNHNKVEIGIMSDNEQIVAQQPDLVPFSYNVAGVIAINTVLLQLDCLRYRLLSLQCTSMGTTGVVTPEWSLNGTTWVTATLATQAGATATTFNAAGLWTIPVFARYFRLRLSTATTAGTTTIELHAYAAGAGVMPSQTVQGSVTATGIAGAGAHDAAISGNPVRIGGRALTANYTAVATGETADLVTTLVGALISKPYAIPESDWQYAAASGGIVNTTDVVAKAAAAAGIRNYVTGIQVRNTNAVATEFVIKDGATVIWRTQLPASMAGSMDVQFPTPLRGTAATAVNIACITTGAAVYANLQGYIAP